MLPYHCIKNKIGIPPPFFCILTETNFWSSNLLFLTIVIVFASGFLLLTFFGCLGESKLAEVRRSSKCSRSRLCCGDRSRREDDEQQRGDCHDTNADRGLEPRRVAARRLVPGTIYQTRCNLGIDIVSGSKTS